MRTSFLGLLLVVALTGCGSITPGTSLKEVELAEGPVIIQRGDHFYLRYRRALENGHFPISSYVLGVKKTQDAGYYFFSVPLSNGDFGNLKERPLAFDGLEEFARRGQIYWLDPDGAKHKIPVQPDSYVHGSN